MATIEEKAVMVGRGSDATVHGWQQERRRVVATVDTYDDWKITVESRGRKRAAMTSGWSNGRGGAMTTSKVCYRQMMGSDVVGSRGGFRRGRLRHDWAVILAMRASKNDSAGQ
ncbi:hypothetical protein B296_00010936 [Ensete ventricosum]|uniref:Uncharacterized protein n=1 Tax=Ensete ventricosum TaxID=4639 RepID=A0A427AJX9_ENSVE|nr:hypothetical protein B296_00010936 [Ensete ventricosum]